MTRTQRLLELAKIIMTGRNLDSYDQLSCADCLMVLPDRYIPRFPSLRHFAFDIVEYFFGDSDHCEMNYPQVASYIKRWKRVWCLQPRPISRLSILRPSLFERN